MERHEYRDVNFWKTLDKTDYAIISSINQEAMSKLIEMMRGKRTVEKYAYECNIGTSTLYKTCSKGRKKPLQYEQLISLYEHRDLDCGVGFEHLLAANGMVLLHDVLKLQKKILKKKGVYLNPEPSKKEKKLESKQKEACGELKKLLNEMRGNRDYAAYAAECGLPKGTLIYIANKQRKTALSEMQLKSLYDHRVLGCPVSMEDLRKANSHFPNTGKKGEAMEALLDTSSSESTCEKKPVRSSVLTYDDFLEDLAFYLLKKPADLVPDVRSRCQEIFKDKDAVDLLHKFRNSSEMEWNSRVGAVRNFFENKSLLALPASTSDIMEQLDSMLVSFSAIE